MPAVTSLRRIIVLVMLATAGGALIAWLRDRAVTPVPANPPEWPPLTAAADAAPEPWRAPHDDGSCPDGFAIKANSSGIYHVPGGRFYDRTNPERCYADATAAEADDYRRSKS